MKSYRVYWIFTDRDLCIQPNQVLMKTDPHDIDPQKQKGINHITEEKREEALIELMAKIIVDKIVRDNPEKFPNKTIQGE